MSLILRKKCQGLLDKNGLKDLHVGVESKILVIKGSCGKVIVHVGGINFNTNSITKAEIEFAAELFDGFIKEHVKKIRAFIGKMKELTQLKAPLQTDFGGSTGYAGNSNFYISSTIEGRQYNTTYTSTYINLSSVNIEHINTYITQVKEGKVKADKYFEALDAYNDSQKELSALRADIASCDI